jgi:hypothetical protein
VKPHAFKGSGPGFECLYVAGSEDGARQCKKQVADPIHVVVRPPSVLEKIQTFPEHFTVRGQFWPGSSMAVWQGHSDAVLALLKKKDVAYGNAWQKQGYMGNLARILSKTSRLKNMLWRDEVESVVPEGQDESVLDTLYDLSALCALAIANIEEGNRWGK